MTSLGRDKSTHADDEGQAQNGTHAARDADVDRGGEAVGQAKFDLGTVSAQLPRDQIPWGYGTVRMTAIARDPDWLYVYWEVTDEAIAAARSKLGAGGPEAWCCLRVYDTTGRTFDGTNANEYFDIAVDRSAREWFIHIGKPTSVHHVDIGLKSREGFFQVIARSGRAENPRKSPSRDMTIEWMTVEAEAPKSTHPTARPYESRFPGPPPVVPSRPPVAPQESRAPQMMQSTSVVRMPYAVSWRSSWSEGRISAWTTSTTQRYETHYSRLAVPWLSTAWRSEWQGDQRAFEWVSPLHALTWAGPAEGFSWVGPIESYSWVAGPYPVGDISSQERVEVRYVGAPQTFATEGGRAVVVHGPWEVSIRPFEAPGVPVQRKLLGTWLIHWVRPTAPVIERWETSQLHGMLTQTTWQHFVAGASESLLLSERGASEWWTLGASEWMWLGASEWLLIGASELAWLGASASLFAWMGQGASEWAWAGASEQLAAGASEWAAAVLALGGGSEQWGAGASEQFAAGASEWAWAGASESMLGGASELAGGASEWLGASERLGASEWMMGASEWLGASEQLGGASDFNPAGGSEQGPDKEGR